MEDLLVVTGVIELIVGVLCIILFFKIWGMTNDVNKIQKRFCKYEDLEFEEVKSELNKYIIRGDKDGAKSFLTECLLSQLVTISDNSSEYNYIYKHIASEYTKLFAKIGEKKLPYNLEGLGSNDFRQILESGLK